VVRLELFLFVLHSFQKVNSMFLFFTSNLNGIQEQLLLGLDKKQPKIVAACVSILAEAVKYNSSLFSFFFSFFLSDNLSAHTTVCVTFARGFGPQTLNPKPVLKAIPKIFGHADNAVRAEVGLVLRSFFFFFFCGKKKIAQLSPFRDSNSLWNSVAGLVLPSTPF